MKDLNDCSLHFAHKILHCVLRIIIEKILHCVQNDKAVRKASLRSRRMTKASFRMTVDTTAYASRRPHS